MKGSPKPTPIGDPGQFDWVWGCAQCRVWSGGEGEGEGEGGLSE